VTRFDAWHASFRSDAFRTARDLLGSVLGAVLEPRPKGIHGYTHSELVKIDGSTHGLVAWGGVNDRPLIQVNGEPSAKWAEAIQSLVLSDCGETPLAMLTRADVCFDWIDPFDVCSLAPGFRAAVSGSESSGRPVQWDMRGDWDTLEGRKRGCTLYMGASTSSARIRLYDKGAEQIGKLVEAPQDLRRLELQFRPNGKIEKAEYVSLRPSEFWGMTRATRIAARHFGVPLEDGVSRHYSEPSDIEKLQTLASVQYGPAIVAMVSSLLGPGAAETLEREVQRRKTAHQALVRLRA